MGFPFLSENLNLQIGSCQAAAPVSTELSMARTPGLSMWGNGSYLCRLARCWRYLAFCFALPEPCAPVIYFFFLALVFTLSSSFFGPDDPLKLMPFSNIL